MVKSQGFATATTCISGIIGCLQTRDERIEHVRSRADGMKPTCSWCRSEGKLSAPGDREPVDDSWPTRGICSRHQEQLLESLPSSSFPEVELLLVVHRKEAALYAYLQRTLAGVRGVKVIMERRRADRRREQRPSAADRRREPRRIRLGKVLSLGYTLVRFRRR